MPPVMVESDNNFLLVSDVLFMVSVVCPADFIFRHDGGAAEVAIRGSSSNKHSDLGFVNVHIYQPVLFSHAC